MFGPFCLETIVTPDQKFYIIEISCRIVAGTNLFTSGSPYSALIYDEPMSTGRRIAREIKNGITQKRLKELLD
jgi:5-formaminoimidazole-4-carboxamide-1-(beta)-D-ribofuranosyl 5'-monophosphate synthetase